MALDPPTHFGSTADKHFVVPPLAAPRLLWTPVPGIQTGKYSSKFAADSQALFLHKKAHRNDIPAPQVDSELAYSQKLQANSEELYQKVSAKLTAYFSVFYHLLQIEPCSHRQSSTRQVCHLAGAKHGGQPQGHTHQDEAGTKRGPPAHGKAGSHSDPCLTARTCLH